MEDHGLKFFRKLSLPSWSFPLFLLAIAVLAYGLLIAFLGFFWDDWPIAWIFRTYGREGFARFFSTNRPLWGVFHQITLTLVGTDSLLKWQVVAITTRWLTVLALWWSLRQLWPERQAQAGWAALLFLVYPGFGQQSIPIMHTNHTLVHLVFLLSLGFMGLALRQKKLVNPYWLLSIALAGLTMFTTEYYLGLEAARPIMLFILLWADQPDLRHRIKSVSRFWWPYLVLILVYAYWRVFVISFTLYQPVTVTGLAASPLKTAWELVITVFQDVFVTGLAAWFNPFRVLQFDLASRTGQLNLAVLIAAGLFVLVFMSVWKT